LLDDLASPRLTSKAAPSSTMAAKAICGISRRSFRLLQEGCEFFLVFDDGSMPEAALANLPTDYEHDRYIFVRQVPGPKSADSVRSAAGLVPHTFSHRLMEQEPIITEGSWVRISDSNNVPAGSTMAAALVNLEPGAMRELHWHEHDQWQYYTKAAGP
jgi:oxalate decarboxylase